MDHSLVKNYNQEDGKCTKLDEITLPSELHVKLQFTRNFMKTEA